MERLTLLVLLLSSITSAQGTKSPATTVLNDPVPPADCYAHPTTSCFTFNEMIAAKDKGVSDLQNKTEINYVCFEDTDDKFLMVGFDPPTDNQWVKVGNRYKASGLHSIALFVYKAGIKDGPPEATTLA